MRAVGLSICLVHYGIGYPGMLCPLRVSHTVAKNVLISAQIIKRFDYRGSHSTQLS